MAKRERPTHVFGYELDPTTLLPIHKKLTVKPGDYGCDPLSDGTYRMVPSGDIVDAAERDRRLKR